MKHWKKDTGVYIERIEELLMEAQSGLHVCEFLFVLATAQGSIALAERQAAERLRG